MSHALQFFIDGEWVDPAVPARIAVIDPSTEEAYAEIAVGSPADIDRAVAAARRAFETYSQTTREERLALLGRVIEVYRRRMDEMGAAISREMGAPRPFAVSNQAGSGLAHLLQIVETLESFEFEELRGKTLITREPIGVVGMITPWNWPMNQIACKVGPALAAGCTMVLKPSEIAPMSGILFAEILEEAGVPKGVFSFVNGFNFNVTRTGPAGAAALGTFGHRPAPWGAGHHEYFGHSFGAYAIGDDLPQAGNRVTLSDTDQDSDGLPAARLHYQPHENDLRIMHFSMKRLRDLARSVDAFDVAVTDYFENGVYRTPAWHMLGTCRMGADPETSTVDRWHQAWEVPNLYVCDGSSFATGGVVNPTSTVTALALRCARHIAGLAGR